ncbi:hypothetical protein FRX31_008385 [Thalictrum thalictroides]|uniref:Uncharacterized protein n=1 Tax=Thalictrum thalictroides TaxID=46969 RepID=A0A7J6WZL2_THATH|nr:hypothetical protein FRX31_008385 [Thalictrum thalictroides]
MNKALKAKWIWRYGNEEGALWRSVIDAKYGFGDEQWWPRRVSQSHGCSLWRGIMEMFQTFKESISCRLGNGSRIRFWTDILIGNLPLCNQFPQIYIISDNRNATIAQFCHRVEEESQWNLQIRRTSFDWEVDELNAL